MSPAELPSPDEDFDAAIMRPKRRKRRSPNKAVSSAAQAPVVEITDDITEAAVRSVPIAFADEPTDPEVPVAPLEEPIPEEPEAAPAPQPEFEPPVADPEPESPEDVALSELPEEDSTEVEQRPAAPIALPKRRMARLGAARLRLAGEVVIVTAVVALAGLSLQQAHQKATLEARLSNLQADPSQLVQQQTQDLIGRVGRLMQLPQNETPTVASVSDAAQAASQSAFFKNAQNGDKVLVYVKSGEAILYRPSTDRIVLVAPLDLSTLNGQPSGTQQTTP